MSRFRDSGYSVGENIQLYRRIREQLNNRATAAHEARVNIGDKVVEITPDYENENIDKGTATGAVLAALSTIFDEYFAPIAADTEIAETEQVDGGTRYKVNVDAPFEQQAKFKAMMEAGTGFTSLFIDSFEKDEPEAVRQRVARDTWEIDVVVKDAEVNENTRDKIGFGLFN